MNRLISRAAAQNVEKFNVDEILDMIPKNIVP